jgi:hypothetical protein
MREEEMESVMTTNMKRAQELLFGAEGLGVSNFKMYPGTNSDTTAEEVAQEVADAMEDLATRLSAGELVEEVLA